MSAHLPKVTIVTPSFNQAEFLEQTMLSVLNQDYPNIEYIVMDGGSTDGSVEIISRYESRLAHWESIRDRGQSHAINKGLAKATGEVFNWLNSDDLLMPSAVRLAVSYLERRADIGVVYGDRVRIDSRGNTLSVDEGLSFRRDEMLYNLRIPQETVFIRRSLLKEVGGVDENLAFCMDYDLWIRLNKMAAFHHIPFVMGAYREHGKSKSMESAASRNSHGRKEIAEVMRRHFGRVRSRWGKKLYDIRLSVRGWCERSSRARSEEIRQITRIVEEHRE